MCWRQFWYAGDGFGRHSLYFNISLRHQHSKDVTNTKNFKNHQYPLVVYDVAHIIWAYKNIKALYYSFLFLPRVFCQISFEQLLVHLQWADHCGPNHIYRTEYFTLLWLFRILNPVASNDLIQNLGIFRILGWQNLEFLLTCSFTSRFMIWRSNLCIQSCISSFSRSRESHI